MIIPLYATACSAVKKNAPMMSIMICATLILRASTPNPSCSARKEIPSTGIALRSCTKKPCVAKNFSCTATPRRAGTGLPVTNSISEKLRLQRPAKSSCEMLKLVTPIHKIGKECRSPANHTSIIAAVFPQRSSTWPAFINQKQLLLI